MIIRRDLVPSYMSVYISFHSFDSKAYESVIYGMQGSLMTNSKVPMKQWPDVSIPHGVVNELEEEIASGKEDDPEGWPGEFALIASRFYGESDNHPCSFENDDPAQGNNVFYALIELENESISELWHLLLDRMPYVKGYPWDHVVGYLHHHELVEFYGKIRSLKFDDPDEYEVIAVFLRDLDIVFSKGLGLFRYQF